MCLTTCGVVATATGLEPLADDARRTIDEQIRGAGARRATAFWASRSAASNASEASTASDEADLAFAGFLLFLDPPKPGVEETLAELAAPRHRGQDHFRATTAMLPRTLRQAVGLARRQDS